MKITIRLVVALVLAVAVTALLFTLYQVREERARLESDLERRAVTLSSSLRESVVPLIRGDDRAKLLRLVQRFRNADGLRGIVVQEAGGETVASAPALLRLVDPPRLPAGKSAEGATPPAGGFGRLDGAKVYVHVSPLLDEGAAVGRLAIVQDAGYTDARLEAIWRHNFARTLIMSVLIAAITLVVVRWSVAGPVARIADWMRDLRTNGATSAKTACPEKDVILDPLISEASRMARSLASARARAAEEAELRVRADSLWTASRLKEHMRVELGGKKLYLVSNREPYLHTREGRKVRCVVPAGGLVTALDPVMRVCDGLWIAHGSGDADREAVDARDSLRVPPDEPAYTLRRIWLTRDEEEGYYYGFANEGLWPLCHITHTRPLFRLEDWVRYRSVNEKFAAAVLKEIEGEEWPLVLVQDYHLALVPRFVKERRPDAKVALFWHIPWPNPEAYGICPWRQEILLGMLGADIVGFHIQFHCNNFLETIDRFLESKIDWEQFSAMRGGHTTLIKPYPISVGFDRPPEAEFPGRGPGKEELLHEVGVQAAFLGVGVDRIDYTKGIPERFAAVERFFETHPEFLEKFTFVELGAPSRVHIPRYRDLLTEIEAMAERINWRFKTRKWKPIVLLEAQHSHASIEPWYKAADVCMVTSLHDGMNLVAKEYVAARDDVDGALILSQFTGASRELKDALVVNPYDIEEMAGAIHAALTMDPAERAGRMKRMRANVREHNVYRWAGNLVTELARLRLPREAPPAPPERARDSA